MTDRETPLKLVRQWPRMLPGCYERLDDLQRAKPDGVIWWPDYCQLPISAAMAYLNAQAGYDVVAAAGRAAELTACWMWRQNKIIYSFDADLTASLAAQAEDMRDTDVLPMDLLMHLPYPCIYVKAPGMVEDTDGFWAWIEYDVNREAPELRVQYVLDTLDCSIPTMLHLIPGGTLHDCILDTMEATLEHLKGPEPRPKPTVDDARLILTAIQLILYLVAANVDVRDEPPSPRPPRPPAQTDGQRSRRIRDKAGEVTTKLVGVRVGAALRRAGQRTEPQRTGGSGSTGTRMRSHTRRGHWHHYWTGPRGGDRTLILKWNAPTVIHPEDGLEDIVTEYPVK